MGTTPSSPSSARHARPGRAHADTDLDWEAFHGEVRLREHHRPSRHGLPEVGRVGQARTCRRRPAPLGGRHGLQDGPLRRRGARGARRARHLRLHDAPGRLLRGRAGLVRDAPRLAPRARVVRHDAGRGVRPGHGHQRPHPARRRRGHPAARVLPLPLDDRGQRPQGAHEPASLRGWALLHGLRGLRARARGVGRQALHPLQPPQPGGTLLDGRRAAPHRADLPAPQRGGGGRRDPRRLRPPRLCPRALREPGRGVRPQRHRVHRPEQDLQPGGPAALQHLHPRPRHPRGLQARARPHGLRRAERLRRGGHAGLLRARRRVARRAEGRARGQPRRA